MEHVSEGLIPNRFPDHARCPTTIRSMLRYGSLPLCISYEQHSGDSTLADELWPTLCDIIRWHERGTRYHIGVDADGLLHAGEHGTQLTWMDAKVGDWVVTPRQGKAVEVNALWYAAISVRSPLQGGAEGAIRAAARQGRRGKGAFCAQFWNDELGCLYDVVNADSKDASIRPNQLLALSALSPFRRGKG